MAPGLEFWLYLPQMRMTMEQIVTRARVAESQGFAGIAGMDHLAPPLAETAPMYEATVTNTWLAAHTEQLGVGSLVLCDAFRHPAVLAREAVSLDHASGGRFELGLGWGSVPAEFGTFGIGTADPRQRVARLKETLEILEGLWTGEPFDYDGEYFTMRGAHQHPVPLGRIPMTIGGAGPKTMELVAAHADWWNVHVGIMDRLEEMRSRAGRARCSVQVQCALVTDPSRWDDVAGTARRRMGRTVVVGGAPELTDYFGGLAARGVERVYVWFADFGVPETLAAFGEGVIAALGPTEAGA
jgi:alkanesulfonate monooxygenase SsuD/methylene tetrahydromethanopterin reductase-like flavin-dependent oxidoreductase (luciferase family)